MKNGGGLDRTIFLKIQRSKLNDAVDNQLVAKLGDTFGVYKLDMLKFKLVGN